MHLASIVQLMGLLDSETQEEKQRTLGSRTESLGPPFPLGPGRSRRSDDVGDRRTCPPTLHSVQLLLRPEPWKWTDTWSLNIP